MALKRLKPAASTGPRSEERGDPPYSRPSSRRPHRFNGAALRRARRYDFFEHACGDGAALQRGRAPKSAEMSRWDAQGSTGQPLQRGRAPKSAEIGGLIRGSYNIVMLQRGRAPKSAEITTDRGGGGRWCRFNGAALRRARRWRWQAPHRFLREASTGPRSEERGDRPCGRRSRRLAGLQRGRAPKSAEICGSGEGCAGISQLQRGRAPKSAEICDAIRKALPKHRFNGAALRRARRSLSARWSDSRASRFNGAALRRARRSG